MSNKLTTQDFIVKARIKHGDKFGYDKVNYINAETKIIVTCKKHGDFLQKPGNHLFGACCRQCRVERTGKANSMSQDEFISKSQKIHGQRYDYSKVAYVGCFLPVEIICHKHGSFFQKPSVHLTYHGCGRCGQEGKRKVGVEQAKKKAPYDFVENAMKTHGNLYDYSKVSYQGSLNPVSIICFTHGVFRQIPKAHLSGQGCPSCSPYPNKRKTTSEFIRDAVKIHGNLYDYSLVDYKNAHSSVIIICSVHGAFEQKAYCHLNGHGCRTCKLSRGELKIYNFLNSLGVEYQRQKTFPGCKNKWRLRYDFYLELNDTKILIEYDGEQHINPNGWKKPGSFERIQRHDAIKTKFAQDNGFILIRIPYTEFDNVETILKSHLHSDGLEGI